MMHAAAGARPRSSHAVEALIAASIFLASFAYFGLTAHLTLELRDEGYLFYSIARVAAGEIPHRDFAELYGPGVYALTAPLFSWFGEQVIPVRWLLVGFRAAAVALAYLIARHLVPRRFALVGAFVSAAYWGRVLWSLNTPYAALFTIPLCTLSLALLLRGLSRPRPGPWLGAAGLFCGAAFTFKWSLAAVSAYGMVLGICASVPLREGPDGGPRLPVLLALAAAGVALIAPFLSMISFLDYLLHFAPFHGLLVLLGVRFARFGDARVLVGVAGPRIAWFCAGLAIVPAGVCALYLSWGALGDLLHNLLRPRSFQNYYLPVEVPLSRAVPLPLAVCVVSTLLAWLRGGWTAVTFLALGSALLVPAGLWSVAVEGSLALSIQRSTLLFPAIVSFATLVLIGRELLRATPEGDSVQLPALVVVLLFQEMMTFQIFPRGLFNVALMAGTLGPLIGYLLFRWEQASFGGDAVVAPWRRRLAFALVAAFPLLFVGGIVRSALRAPGLAAMSFQAPALAGVRVPVEDRDDLVQFDRLVGWLDDHEPRDAPLFVIANDAMLYFASRREPLFPEHSLVLFLVGWNLLPPGDPELPDEAFLVERLRQRPETLVVIRSRDGAMVSFVSHYPGVGRSINAAYEKVARFGPYLVVRRASVDL